MLTTDGSGKICILPDEVIGRIAAGEVVERPAAVVKELLENSIDAGSRAITVDVKDGGLSLIRVTDDGEGMSREDAPRAFQRHATSKLRSDVDLWSIRTMGFRGEALPSIAAVAHVRLFTAARGAELGTELEVVGGLVGNIADAPPVTGTRIEVADLFKNQPARKKFLKSIPTENSHIARVVQQAALAWPSIQFRLTHNALELMNYPAVRSEADRIAQVYQPAFLEHCVSLNAALPGVVVSGYIVDAIHAKSSRTPQEVFVNRRPIRSLAVSHAVGEGYGAFVAKGCHPRFVLFLEVDPDRVDVNVHPTKREVRFSDNETVHQLVRRAVRQALSRDESPSNSSQPARFAGSGQRNPSPVVDPSPVRPSLSASSTPSVWDGADSQLAFVNETSEPYTRVPSSEVIPLGQINRTYLVAQIGEDLSVIDQHTAHERVLFERLLRAWTTHEMESQALLIPDPVDVSPVQAALFQRYQSDLAKLGLEIDPFGASTVLIRSTPVGLGRIDARMFLQDLFEDLAEWDSMAGLDARVRAVLASMACHGAVRAGRLMRLEEIKVLVEEWCSEGQITTCPHGRRTSFQLTINELEKMFGRVGW